MDFKNIIMQNTIFTMQLTAFVHSSVKRAVVVKFLALGGIICSGVISCPNVIIPASYSLGVEVNHILMPELSTVPV